MHVGTEVSIKISSSLAELAAPIVGAPGVIAVREPVMAAWAAVLTAVLTPPDR
jgi:hypothetical protein